MLSKKEAKKLGFEFIYYNPYSKRGDRYGFGVLFVISLIGLIIGLRWYPRLFLIINSTILLAILIVFLIDLISSERI